MKKILGLILALAMLLGCVAYAQDDAQLSQDVVVLFTSDVHCGIDQGFGYAGLAAVRDSLGRRFGKHWIIAALRTVTAAVQNGNPLGSEIGLDVLLQKVTAVV